MTHLPTPSESRASSPAIRFGLSLLSLIGVALFVQTILEAAQRSAPFFSQPRWASIVALLGGKVSRIDLNTPDGRVAPIFIASVSLAAVIGIVSITGLLATAIGVLLQDSRLPLLSRLLATARRLAAAWVPAGLWWLLWMISVLTDSTLRDIPEGTADLTAAACVGLSVLALWPRSNARAATNITEATKWPPRPKTVLIAGMVTYVVVFTAMNWGLWFNLLIPHGDSAMYEEHLWNLEHGKGFRSYLDQGLFLGEHLQVVHLFLIPLHLVFPSHLTLEFAQSVILALGAWPVFNIARRHSGSDRAAALLGLAYLAYFPLQYLDISIDIKTFRPNSFGIPTLLAAIDLLERRRYGWAAFWLAITLSAQEDWAIPIALIGAYFAAHALLARSPRSAASSLAEPADPIASGRARRRELIWGIGLFVFGVLYLWFALSVAIPWFRGGSTVHTASYFSKFGNTPREIIVTLLTDWSLLYSTIVTPAALVYALRLLLPIGFLPLLSPGRLLVAAPLFLLLLMNDLAMETPGPVHHFHAPLIPILFWAAAAGLRPRDRVTASGG